MTWAAGACTTVPPMAAPNSGPTPGPDPSEGIASTYQFQAFTDSQDSDEPAGRGLSSATVVAVVVIAAIVLGLVGVLLVL